MRVITGSAKGISLSAVKNCKTRPILDRVKESLFSILADSIVGANVIDLFAGTGGLGIEALSRGALSCIFVDKSYEATHIIKKNLEKTSLLDRSRIIKSDVFTINNNQQFNQYIGLPSNCKEDLRQFDVILVGAPYPVVEQEHTRKALFELFKEFVENQIVSHKGIIVLQHKKERLNISKNLYSIEIYDSRVYGKTQITFLRPYVDA